MNGDWIKIEGKVYENVYIRETVSRYYVQIPQDGTTVTAGKSTIDADDIFISKNAAAREAVLAEWKRNYKLRHPKAGDITKKLYSPGAGNPHFTVCGRHWAIAFHRHKGTVGCL